jgi:hypothetical protein
MLRRIFVPKKIHRDAGSYCIMRSIVVVRNRRYYKYLFIYFMLKLDLPFKALLYIHYRDSWLTFFKEVITVYIENHREPIYTKKVIDYLSSSSCSFPVLELLIIENTKYSVKDC